MIIESSSSEHFKVYDKIKEDILNGLSVTEVRAKYDISEGKWIKFRKELIKEGIIKSARERVDTATYTYPKNGKYTVVKRIDGVQVYYGTNYNTKEDGMKVVEKLKKCNWDKSKLQSIREELKV